ncbi:MAG: hypothetical protein F4Z62_06460 [Rhodothermaceae bacterium]|nr:hypothetical protein [Rhodothermaceae bacterium]
MPPLTYKRGFTTSLMLSALFHVSAFSQEVIHPTKDNIPTSSDPRFELRHEVNGVEGWNWNSLDVSTIGVNEGDRAQMIGFVYDLETDHNGTVYYLDLINEEIRAYDYKGDWIMNVGSPGIGPGELDKPRGLTIVPNLNRIIVNDRLMSHVFERTDSSIQLLSTKRLKHPSITGKICAMNGHYYLVSFDIQGSTANGLIHKYTLDGEWVTSFGEPYDYDSRFVVYSFATNTFLACNAANQTVALVTNAIPAMRGYSDQGEKLWQVTFPDYQPRSVKEYWKNGRPTISYLSEPGEAVFSSLFSDDEFFYVTYYLSGKGSKSSSPSRPAFSDSHAFKVNAFSGLGVYLGAAGPEIGEFLLAMDGDYRFTYTENLGFPQIRIYRPK